jgi:maltose O-acetyltransferase
MISNILRRIAIALFPPLDLKFLQKSGLCVGKNTYIGSSLNIDHNYCWLISIGDNCIIAPNVQIIAHDSSSERLLGFFRLGRVSIGSNTYVGVNSVILPNVRIGDRVIIGAGSVVTRDIPSDCVALGNPARVIESTSEFKIKHDAAIDTFYRYSDIKKCDKNHEIKKMIKKAVEKKSCYVKL